MLFIFISISQGIIIKKRTVQQRLSLVIGSVKQIGVSSVQWTKRSTVTTHYKQEREESALSIQFIFPLSGAKADFEEATQTRSVARLFCSLTAGVSQLSTSFFQKKKKKSYVHNNVNLLCLIEVSSS